MSVHVCPPRPRTTLDLRTPLAVGFGFVAVYCDGKVVWRGDDAHVWLRRFDRRAQKREGAWSVHFCAPLVETWYVRTIDGEWVLAAKGLGFA